MLEVVLYVMSIGWFASVVALAAKSIIYVLAADEPPPLMVTAVLFCKMSQSCEFMKDEKIGYNKMDVAIGNTAPFQAKSCRDRFRKILTVNLDSTLISEKVACNQRD